MRLRESLRLSWRSIRGHKLRSTLTTLGVVIGIAAVITFVTLGVSLEAGILGDVDTGQTNRIYVWGSPVDEGGGPGEGAELIFTQRDVTELRNQSDVAAAYPWTPLPSESIRHGNETLPMREGVVATGTEYLEAEDLADGRRFEAGEREAVLNPAAANRFEENVSLGDTVAVSVPGAGEVNATVVGLLDTSEGQGPFEGFGEDPRVYLPADPYYLDLASEATDDPRYLSVVVEAEDPRDVDAARDSAREYLTSNASDASDYLGGDLELTMQTGGELLEQIQDILDQVTAFVTGIAVISLVVGAIGIANIMLVSVTERTREIGIMKAVGAQNRDVLTLFLTEAVILGVIGAIGGTLLGAVGGWAAAEYADLPLTYPLEWFGIAVGVGILVGVVSGLYPAWRAARTDPIDALRYE
ncbi:ABC transporter permease [Halostella sp. JP-L12]|uniref:ABC transporter permease n=1 Tax=Halostella TaxID=1843185 RepID=UPI000EF763AF|nr:MULTISPECIES: ABC transporter permease [Halostella]NHN46065.1 ABC transporter permease [Halostella sp. JP-L12]